MPPMAEVAQEEKAEVEVETKANMPTKEKTPVVTTVWPLNLEGSQLRTSPME